LTTDIFVAAITSASRELRSIGPSPTVSFLATKKAVLASRTVGTAMNWA
jgi:hypothetical protein